jgi:lipopolysaccharide transport system permease protein
MVSSATIVIKPSRGWSFPDFREIWEFRELLFFFAWRDIKVRYKQTVLGAAWAVIQPFFTMIVFTIFFGRFAQIPSEGLPYPIFSYAALVPWTYFANNISQISASMVTQRGIMTKVYFPRLLIPLASIISGLVDFSIAFTVLLAMMFYYGIIPTAIVIFVPLFTLFSIVAALGAGLWLSTMNVMYRDVGYAMPFLVQFWLFATPIAYPASLVPPRWRAIYGINPMTGVIEGFRWSLLGAGEGLDPLGVAVSVLIVIVMLITGLLYFERNERRFADIV